MGRAPRLLSAWSDPASIVGWIRYGSALSNDFGLQHDVIGRYERIAHRLLGIGDVIHHPHVNEDIEPLPNSRKAQGLSRSATTAHTSE